MTTDSRPSFDRRFKQRLAAAAVIALIMWLLEFATHLHAAEPIDSGATGTTHACAFCAAFPVAAGTVAALPILPVGALPVPPERLVARLTVLTFVPYRSRAPPAPESH